MKKSEQLMCILDCLLESKAFRQGYSPEEKCEILQTLTYEIYRAETDEILKGTVTENVRTAESV